jgi:FkbM family methyltransferase
MKTQAAPKTKDDLYNEQTFAVMKRALQPTSSCIDVGAYKGDILAEMVKYAPKGTHYAFEPLPHLYKTLQKRFTSPQIKIYELALSDFTGTSVFTYVASNEGYSGFKQRNYDRPDEVITKITVKVDTLDRVLPTNAKIDFIKIDVEGAEFQVLRGAKQTIRKSRPIIVFEHGLGASDHYKTKPEDIYQLLSSELGLKINLLERWLKGQPHFSLDEFKHQYYKGLNYFFIASP